MCLLLKSKLIDDQRSSVEASSTLGTAAPMLSNVFSSKRPADQDAEAYSKLQSLDYEMNKRERLIEIH